MEFFTFRLSVRITKFVYLFADLFFFHSSLLFHDLLQALKYFFHDKWLFTDGRKSMAYEIRARSDRRETTQT